jgi:hypothetical protein
VEEAEKIGKRFASLRLNVKPKPLEKDSLKLLYGAKEKSLGGSVIVDNFNLPGISTSL